ncbi:MAG: alpha/beta hydrolase domain-containing protein [Microthrixaceae bacterium]
MSFVAPAPPSRARMRHQARITAIMASVLMLSVLMLSTGCSETTSADGANADGIGGTDADAATGPTTTIARTRADGPGADLSQELTGGNGVFMGSMATKGQAEAGYIETELVAAGDAVRYDAGPEWTEDGRWDFTQLDEAPAPYRTRALGPTSVRLCGLQRDGGDRMAQRERGSRRRSRVVEPAGGVDP